MKFKHLLLLFLLWVIFQENSYALKSSIIKGRITDIATKDPLPGASVTIAGTTNGTATNIQGEYSLKVEAGDYQLAIKYLGFKDTTVNVSIKENEIVTLDIKLYSDVLELNEVVIDMMQGQAKALNQQKNADNIKNIVAADQIGRFPDPNAAEALQRVSGINIERDQGEGRYVLVRGLAPQFTNMNINGEQVPSPEADKRFVALDAIPADQLSSMEVSKTLTPDMDGDAIGGSINLITKTATSSKLKTSASFAGGYNSLMKRGNTNGSLQMGKRFGKNEKLGIIINTSYYSNNLGSDNWERNAIDNEFELRDYELTRTRLGLSSTIDYKLGKYTEVYFRTLYSRFTDREWRRGTLFIPEDGEIEKNIKDRFESQSITSINLGAKHIFPKLQIDYEAQYSYGEQKTPYDYQATFVAGVDNSINFSNINYPLLNAPRYLNNSLFDFDELEVGNTLAKDRNLTAKANLGIPYKIGSSEGLLKFGGKIRLKDKSFSITQNKYESLGGVPALNNLEGGLLDKSFLNGQYQLSSSADMGKLISYFNNNPAEFELQIADKATDEALESFQASENVYAGYVMTRQQFKKILLVGGIRYERTNVKYSSKDVVIAPNGDLQEIRTVTGASNYDLFLPQVNFKYALNKKMNLRAAATYSYARPNFTDIVPSQEANLADKEATVGNPMLKPVKALNADVLTEKYFGNVGIISGGIFYKKLDNFIYKRTFYNSQYPLNGTPIATGLKVTQSQNGNDANLLGFELALQRNLTFLPGFLSGFKLYMNYTYTKSNAKIQSRNPNQVQNPDATESLKLPGQATHVGNISLAYQNEKISIRGSLNFNGGYLSEVGSVAAEDIFVKNRMQFDLNASYALNKNARLFAEFLNLTNQPFEVYQGTSSITIQREFYSWWSKLGIKIDL